MDIREAVIKTQAELETGMGLTKCRQCGCMEEVLNALTIADVALEADEVRTLAANGQTWKNQMQPLRYACLGCEHCYAAVAQNALTTVFPVLAQAAGLGCEFQLTEGGWPSVVGEYVVLNRTASVAVSTLASIELVDAVAQQEPQGLAIVGKTETENIGIDKVVKNVIANPSLRYLIVAGEDPTGHLTGRTLLALARNGIDEKGRVIDSPGKRPILRNVSFAEVETFRQQIQVVDLIGCHSVEEIAAQVEILARTVTPTCSCADCSAPLTLMPLPATIPTLRAEAPDQTVKMDKAGYFVIVPLAAQGILHVEHYTYNNTLLHAVKGQDARSIYRLIIDQGWVSELSHAAYLGKELAKAELSLTLSFKYIQDGA